MIRWRIGTAEFNVHIKVVSSTCKDQEHKVCRRLELLLQDILTYLERS